MRARGARARLRTARLVDRLCASLGELDIAPAGDVDSFVDQILLCCPMVRSIWLLADCLNGGPHQARFYMWDLLAFADPLSLHRLRKALKPVRTDVRLRVIVGANRLESPWESRAGSGEVLASDWRECNPGEGYYTESSRRRKAVCLWQGIDPLTPPGS
jgi:hypothetical protein